MKDGIGSIIALIGIIALVFAQITGIGTWLYTWSTGVALGASMWAGFVIWMKMMGVGVVAFGAGMLIKDNKIQAFTIDEISQSKDGYRYVLLGGTKDFPLGLVISNPKYFNTTKTACANEWLKAQGLGEING